MIQIYRPQNTDYTHNGDTVLLPIVCELTAELNGSWDLTIEHRMDDEGRWKEIVEDAVISVSTFMPEKQLYRIYYIEKSDDRVYANASPIFFDSRKDCFLLDVRPTGKNGKEALDIMCAPNIKYSALSDITKANTSYYIRKNLMEAINGDDENSFLNRWGGEILYDNYTVIINERVGGDHGIEIRYGKNIRSIKETVNTSEIITRIVPVAFNGYTLDGDAPWVDSPNINIYPTIYYKVVGFEDIKLTEDAVGDEVGFDSLDDLRKELIRQCQMMYTMGCDRPKVTLDIDIIDLAKTVEYKDYKILNELSLGDTVHCRHNKLGIITEARVTRIKWDCIGNRPESVIIGDYILSFAEKNTSIENRVSQAIRGDGSVIGQQVKGVIDAANAQFKIQNNAAKKQDVRAILFEDFDTESELYGALSIGTQGWQIAEKRTQDGKDWDWQTAATSKGIIANYILAGKLSDKLGKNFWNLDTGEFQLSSNTTVGDTTLGNIAKEAETARAINIIMDNEYQGIPTDNNGNYDEFPECKTCLKVYYGHTDVSALCTIDINESDGVTGTWDKDRFIYTVTGLATDSGWIEFTAFYLSIFIVKKRFNVVKSKEGATGSAGAAATAYTMQVNTYTIVKSKTGTYSPPSITLSGKSQTGADAMVNYAGRFKIEESTDMSSWAVKYTSSANEASKTYTPSAEIAAIRCSMYLAGGTATLLDQQIVPVVSDGTDGTNGAPGAEGAPAYTVILSNESHSFAGGTSAALAGSTTCGVIAYKGASRVAATIGTISGMPAGMSATVANNSTTSASFTVAVTTAMTTLSGTLTVPVTVDGESFTKVFSYSLALKGATGSAGAAATVYTMQVNTYAIVKSKTGTYSPPSITLSGKSQTGAAAMVNYAGRFKIEESTDMSSWAVKYTSSANEASKTYTPSAEIAAIRCSMYLAGGTATLLDQQIVPVVSDGTDGTNGAPGAEGAPAYTVILSNESHSFAGGTSAALAGSTTCGVIAYKGASRVAATIGTISGMKTGMTVTVYNNSTTSAMFTVAVTTAMTTLSGTLTVPVTVDGKSFTKVFSYSLALKGTTGSTGAAGRVFSLETSTNIIKLSKGGQLEPAYIDFKSYYHDGTDATRYPYPAKFWIEVSSDGNTWETVFKSGSLYEPSIRYSVYTFLTDDDGNALMDDNGYGIGVVGNESLIRCSVYADDFTQLLDRQSVTIVREADSLSFEEIFDLITDDGRVKGIFLKDGQLYFSFTYAQGGELVLGGINNGNGKLKIVDSYGDQIGYIDNTGVNFQKGSINGPSIVAKEGEIAGMKIDWSGITYGSPYPIVMDEGNEIYIGRYGIVTSKRYTDGDNLAICMNSGAIRFYRDAVFVGKISIGDGTATAPLNSYVLYGSNNAPIAGFHQGLCTFNAPTHIYSDLNVYGTKSRVIKTQNYKTRTQYCYEMTSPVFGDIGEGRTDENGEAWISIDDIFSETIVSDTEYQVFLQKEGEGDLWIEGKEATHFVVRGTRNLKFAWEVKAKQKDYEFKRLDEQSLNGPETILEDGTENYIEEQEDLLYGQN